MVRKEKYNRKIEKYIVRVLEQLSKKHGLPDVRHAANKWLVAQRDRASLAKARKELRARLREVNQRLAR